MTAPAEGGDRCCCWCDRVLMDDEVRFCSRCRSALLYQPPESPERRAGLLLTSSRDDEEEEEES